jgi:hypothetical protein
MAASPPYSVSRALRMLRGVPGVLHRSNTVCRPDAFLGELVPRSFQSRERRLDLRETRGRGIGIGRRSLRAQGFLVANVALLDKQPHRGPDRRTPVVPARPPDYGPRASGGQRAFQRKSNGNKRRNVFQSMRARATVTDQSFWPP